MCLIENVENAVNFYINQWQEALQLSVIVAEGKTSTCDLEQYTPWKFKRTSNIDIYRDYILHLALCQTHRSSHMNQSPSDII